jgi:hypothetical protein
MPTVWRPTDVNSTKNESQRHQTRKEFKMREVSKQIMQAIGEMREQLDQTVRGAHIGNNYETFRTISDAEKLMNDLRRVTNDFHETINRAIADELKSQDRKDH